MNKKEEAAYENYKFKWKEFSSDINRNHWGIMLGKERGLRVWQHFLPKHEVLKDEHKLLRSLGKKFIPIINENDVWQQCWIYDDGVLLMSVNEPKEATFHNFMVNFSFLLKLRKEDLKVEELRCEI